MSPEQQIEAEKLVKYIRQMEGIMRTSPSKEQKERVSKELFKYRDRLARLTGSTAEKLNVDEIERSLGPNSRGERASVTARAQAPSMSGHNILDKFEIQKASEHSTDADVNFLFSMLNVLQKEYWPALTEQHCKLDFSCSADRDTVRNKLDNVLRSLTVLVETIDEYAGAEKQDFREQLLKMKNKQSRLFLLETNDTLKELRAFLHQLNEDAASGGSMITNRDSVIKFNSRLEAATMLDGRGLKDGLKEFEIFVNEIIGHLNLPDLKA